MSELPEGLNIRELRKLAVDLKAEVKELQHESDVADRGRLLLVKRAEQAEAERDNWKSHAEERGELLKDITEVLRLCNEQRPTYVELKADNAKLREVAHDIINNWVCDRENPDDVREELCGRYNLCRRCMLTKALKEKQTS